MKFRLPNFLAHSKNAGPWQRTGACLVVLAVLTVLFGQLWAAAGPPKRKDHAEGEGGTPRGKLVQLDDGNPRLGIAAKEDKADSFRCAPDVRVSLNGRDANFTALKLDDTVELIKNDEGIVVEIRAER